MVSLIKTLSEIIAQDFPFFIIRNSLVSGGGGAQGKQEDGKPPSAFEVLESPESLGKFADKTTNNFLKDIQSRLQKERDAIEKNPSEYFKPSNIKKRFVKDAKKEGKPLHVYLSELFQLFLGLAVFAAVACIFYKLFALIFLALYLLVFAVSLMIIHAFFFGLYQLACFFKPTESANLLKNIQQARFNKSEVGSGQEGGTISQTYKSKWNTELGNLASALDSVISRNTVTVYGFTENKVYSYGTDPGNVERYNNLKGYRRIIMPTIPQMAFKDIVGKDGSTIENNIKVIDLTDVAGQVNTINESFTTFQSLINKLENVDQGKIEQVGGDKAGVSDEALALEKSKDNIIKELRDMIQKVDDTKKSIYNLTKAEKHDEIHFANLASNEYWQYILKFPPIRFIIGIIQVYGYPLHSAWYVIQQLTVGASKITEVENPLEKAVGRNKILADSGVDLLYKQNAEGKIDTLTTIFTWLALLCKYMAYGYLALAILMLLLAIINGGLTHAFSRAVETVLKMLFPMLGEMGINLWDFTIKGVIDLLFGGTKAKINRKNELERLNNKFGSGNAKMSPDITTTIPIPVIGENNGDPGKPDKGAKAHLHDLYRDDSTKDKEGKYQFDKKKFEEIEDELSKVDLTSDGADAKLDSIQRKINDSKKMFFTDWNKKMNK